MNNITAPHAIWDILAFRPYLGEIQRQHGVIETVALPNMRDLPPLGIEKLFVQPLISNFHVRSALPVEQWPEGLSLLTAFSKNPRIVLLGDPGSGKTTLANWLIWRLSSGSFSTLPKFLDNKLPIPCVLRELPPEFFDRTVDVFALASSIFKRRIHDAYSSNTESLLESTIKQGQYILVLDGVDEVPISRRQAIARWVNEAYQSNASVLATSRIVGYDDFPIHVQTTAVSVEMDGGHISSPSREGRKNALNRSQDGIHNLNEENSAQVRNRADIYYLMPFDDTRIANFVESWYHQRIGSEVDARLRTEDLLSALYRSSVTRELARTPNLLSLMAIVHRERAHLPDGKALLYKEIANAYINTIDQYRKIYATDELSTFSWEEKESWIAYIGFEMHLLRYEGLAESEGSGVLVEENKVIGWLHYAIHEGREKTSQVDTEGFLSWVARRCGLLIPRGEKRFAFVHLSFQEYFCARFIVNQVISPEFIRNKRSANTKVSTKLLAKWADSTVWHECFIYIFELISAERNNAWVEDLASTIFGSENSRVLLSKEKGVLAAKIIANKHIKISEKRRESLASRCTKAIEFELSYRTIGSSKPAIESLLNTEFATAWISPEEKGSWDFIGANALSDFKKIELSSRLRHIIVRADGRGFRIASPNYKLLQTLTISRGILDDLKFLNRLRNLRYLDIRLSAIKDATEITKLNELIELNVASTNLLSLEPFINCKKLSVLTISDSEISELSSLRNFPELTRFFADGVKVVDWHPLTNAPNLEIISAEENNIEDLEFLRPLKNLQLIFLNDNPIKSLAPFTEHTRIFHLDLSGTNVDSIEAIQNNKTMLELNLDDTNITDISPVRGFTYLRSLSLANTSISDLSALRGHKNLAHIDLSNSKVKDISVLSTIGRLQSANITGCKIEDTSFINSNILIDRTNLSDTP